MFSAVLAALVSLRTAEIRRKSLVPKVGLEPTPSCEAPDFESGALPFRHFGKAFSGSFPTGQGLSLRGGDRRPEGGLMTIIVPGPGIP